MSIVQSELTTPSTDTRGRALPMTGDEIRRRAEEAIRALDDVAEMGDEQEQAATLDALIRAIDAEPMSARPRFRA